MNQEDKNQWVMFLLGVVTGISVAMTIAAFNLPVPTTPRRPEPKKA
jgi:hypothetical protein